MPPYAAVAEASSFPSVDCDGLTVIAIDVHRYAALSEPQRVDSLRPPLDPARAAVIRAYLRLKVGRPCTELDRRESERLLRAQAFVASVAITTRPDGGGTRVRVDVVDEWPYLARAGMSGRRFTSATIGTQNFRGRGTTIAPSWRIRDGYRTGFGLRIAQYGIGGRPAFGEVEGARDPLGGTFRATLSEPYLTEHQRSAWQLSTTSDTRYQTLVRASGEDAAVAIGRAMADATWIARVGSRTRNGAVFVSGVSLMRDELRTADSPVLITEDGLVPTGDSALMGRYRNFVANRIGLVIGARALSFMTVQRHHALRAAEDVGRGMRVSLLAAPTVGAGGASADVLLSGDLYLGAGGPGNYIALRAGGETRAAWRGGRSHGRAVSTLLDWRRLPSDRRTRVTTIAFSAVDRSLVPTQLTFRDLDGGLGSGARSDDAGGARLTVRQEERMLLPWLRSRADVAWAAFVDAGRVWAGDVPYGRTSPVRGSVGLSLLASPRWGKRVLRIDIAMPVNPGPRDGALVLRVRSADQTGTAWMEPRDVARARTGDGPATLTRW